MANHSPQPPKGAEKEMASLLRNSAAGHKRRCAIREGVRESDTQNCPHDWDLAKGWCRKCGLTKFDIILET